MADSKRTIIQLLLFRDQKLSRELGPALWAAFHEVEAFYNAGEQRAIFLRAYFAPKVAKRFRKAAEWTKKPWDEIADQLQDAENWKRVYGRLRRTCDQMTLASWARRLTGPHSPGTHLVLVTDQEITPPKALRYIIWDHVGDKDWDTVISATPVDPKYWQISDERRIATVKHRIRVACLSSVGSALGIASCENNNCLRCKPVNSVLDLDRMIYLGEEHAVPELALRGFDPAPAEPAMEQPVISFSKEYGGRETS
jgi:hypothetical protein